MGRQSLTGSIPSEIKMLSSLVYLDLAENSYLHGSIPDQLYELTTLKYLYLNDNALTGTVSEEIGALDLLEDMYMGQNHYNGGVSFLSNIPSVRKLTLHKNQFQGTIPTNLTLNHAIYIDLSFNKLTGVLPDAEGFQSLKILILDHNQFTGTIPDYGKVGNGSLVILDLSFNALEGSVPAAWVDASNKDDIPSINTINVRNKNLMDAVDNNICKLGVSNQGSLVQLEAGRLRYMSMCYRFLHRRPIRSRVKRRRESKERHLE
jgi:Leucine-rich repeat (LRR) protein